MSAFSTKSIILFDERRADYKSGGEIRIDIPATSVPLLLAKGQSMLRFRIQLDAKDGLGADAVIPICLNDKIGAACLINELTIASIGSGQILETIKNYNQLAYVKSHYTENKTDQNKQALTSGARCCRSVRNNRYFSLNDTTTAPTNTYTMGEFQEVEILLPLELSGLLGPDNKRIVPLIAMEGGLQIRILLETNVNKCVQAVSLQGDGNENDGFGYNHLIPLGAWGTSNIAPQGIAATTLLTLANTSEIQTLDVPATAGQALSRNPVDEFSDLTVAAPVFVDQNIAVYDPVSNILVRGPVGSGSSVSTVGTDANVPPHGEITLKAALGAAPAVVSDLSRVVLDLSQYTINYTIRNVEFIAASVQAPAAYLSEMRNSLNRGINYDYTTATNYQVNQQANATTASIYIPANERRALSILCVPQPLVDVNTGPSSVSGAGANEIIVDLGIAENIGGTARPALANSFRIYADGMKPSRCISQVIEPNNYHFIINNKRTPTRNVDLLRYSHANDATGLSSWAAPGAGQLPTSLPNMRFSAVHIKEVEDAVENVGWEVKNLDRPDQALVIGRNLSRYGHTADLSVMGGELRLNVEYKNIKIQQIWNSYLVHKRRLVLTSTGMSVEI